MQELIELSSRVIDQNLGDVPVNRMTLKLSELNDRIAFVESFSNVTSIATDDGLIVVDTSSAYLAPTVLASLRTWKSDPVNTLVYTHGHLDHVGGSGAFAAEAVETKRPPARVVGHERLPERFQRYELTGGHNIAVNTRQFGGGALLGGAGDRFLPESVVYPDFLVGDHQLLDVGGMTIELRHARGETDDHLWIWIPSCRVLCCGDFFIWNFPNAGNPQKVQRFPLDWALALREMAAMGAELMLPGHGLPVAGMERIASVLTTTADALEGLVRDVLHRMNKGQALDAILHEVRVPETYLGKVYLRPLYDEPEFIVRNVWRLYGGWYDGDPSHLKPSTASVLAVELVSLAGGVTAFVERARELSDAEDHRLACHLVELAIQAEPGNRDAHVARAEIYERRREVELSLMARGVFQDAADASRQKVD